MAQRTKGTGIAAQLRKYLVEHDLRLRDLQAILGYGSIDAVYKLLRYDNGPSVKAARVIAGLLDTSVDSVLLEWERGVERRLRNGRAA